MLMVKQQWIELCLKVRKKPLTSFANTAARRVKN